MHWSQRPCLPIFKFVVWPSLGNNINCEVVFSAADIGGYQLKQRMNSDVLIECSDQQNAMALLLKEKKSSTKT